MNPQSPRWIFLRAYLLVALLVLVTGLILEKLLEPAGDETHKLRESTMMLGSFLFAETLTPKTDGATRANAEQRITKQLQLPASLHALEDFSSLGESYLRLENREIVVMFNDADQAVFYRRMADSEWVLALSPPPATENERAQWIVPLFYSLIALAVFLWIRPLSRDLERLQKSAIAFGEQNFASRVTIPASSWLAPLGTAFNSMAQRIETLLQSHKEMSHAVSHELRTPLARIRFALEMLRDGDNEALHRHCDSISDDVSELNTLIEEMLSYAELNQENLLAKCAPLNIAKWLQQYVNRYKLPNSKIELSLIQSEKEDQAKPQSDTVLVDARLLTRALDNLIGNALRYAKSSIELRVLVDDQYCLIQVADDGPGIPEDKREAVLSAYTRLESDVQVPNHGFGLGLAIVKRIMDLHNGTVVIAAGSTGGADISLRWPVR